MQLESQGLFTRLGAKGSRIFGRRTEASKGHELVKPLVDISQIKMGGFSPSHSCRRIMSVNGYCGEVNADVWAAVTRKELS